MLVNFTDKLKLFGKNDINIDIKVNQKYNYYAKCIGD